MLRGTVVTTAPIGGPYYWQFCFSHGDGAPDAANAAAAVANFLQDIAPAMATSMSMQLQDEWDIINLATGKQEGQHIVSGGSPEPGTDTATLVSPATQGLIRLFTGQFVNGRQIRGRLFVPGITEAANDGGRPTASWRNAVDAAMASLRLDASTAYCVWSRTHKQAPAVTSETVWQEWAVLRSRRA